MTAVLEGKQKSMKCISLVNIQVKQYYPTTIVWLADNSAQNWWNLPISNPKPGLDKAYTKFVENPLILIKSTSREAKIWIVAGK